jgi:DNA-binding NtrC family response regulator
MRVRGSQYFRSFRIPIESEDEITCRVVVPDDRSAEGEHEIDAKVQNLSLSGLGVLLETSIPTDLVVEVHILVNKEEFKFEAKAVRCVRESSSFTVGFTFVEDDQLELKRFMNCIVKLLSPHRLKKHLLELMKSESQDIDDSRVDIVKLFAQIFQETQKFAMVGDVKPIVVSFLQDYFPGMSISFALYGEEFFLESMDGHLEEYRYSRDYKIFDLEGDLIGSLNFLYNEVNEHCSEQMDLYGSCTSSLIPYLLELQESVVEQETVRFFRPTSPREIVMIGKSEQMTSMRAFITETKKDDMSVMVKGPYGSGKSLLAKIIHAEGPRRGAPYIIFSLGDEWSTEGVRNFFKEKESSLINGTVLLKNVDTYPYEVQELLHDIIFSESSVLKGVRVISTASDEIEDLFREGQFHEELFESLKSLSIQIPPLSDRGDDVVEIANYFLSKACEKFSMRPKKISLELMNKIKEIVWFDNINGLRRAIFHAVELNPNAAILSSKNAILGLSKGEDESILKLFTNILTESDYEEQDLVMMFEYHVIKDRLSQLNNDKRLAALSLGMSLKNLNLKLEMVQSLNRREMISA